MKIFVLKFKSWHETASNSTTKTQSSVSLKTRAPGQQFRTALSQSYKPITTSSSLCPAQHIPHTPSQHPIIQPTKLPVSQHSKMLRRENSCKTKYLHPTHANPCISHKTSRAYNTSTAPGNKMNNRTPAIRPFPKRRRVRTGF